MAFSRIELIFILGLSALVLRALPQLFLVGKSFPETWDRLLRYLSYALLCGLISITLFVWQLLCSEPGARGLKPPRCLSGFSWLLRRWRSQQCPLLPLSRD